MTPLRQREPRYENRRLLDLAHMVENCQHCYAATPDGCEPAHETGLESGKAMSKKSHDNRHAALCHTCHVWYDIGTGMDTTGIFTSDFDNKQYVWNRAHKRTFDLYWRNHWLKVDA